MDHGKRNLSKCKHTKSTQKDSESKGKKLFIEERRLIIEEMKERRKCLIEYLASYEKMEKTLQEGVRLMNERIKERKERLEGHISHQCTDQVKQEADKLRQQNITKDKEFKDQKEGIPNISPDRAKMKLELEEWKRQKKAKEDEDKLNEITPEKRSEERQKGLKSKNERNASIESEVARDTQRNDVKNREKQRQDEQIKTKVSADKNKEDAKSEKDDIPDSKISDKSKESDDKKEKETTDENNKKGTSKSVRLAGTEDETKDNETSEVRVGYNLSEDGKLQDLVVPVAEKEKEETARNEKTSQQGKD
ncbi:hypothetical protein CEXT_212261 [Caerostris extrusa]|uniref:Uncharacterized protein n=1 Tax=Caerostris extrusa TaxID=172846 RepID=A0AAV4TK58_CAEEX|nr:hypothetical protein CEXT_212261 [Caerostris extrusa]